MFEKTHRQTLPLTSSSISSLSSSRLVVNFADFVDHPEERWCLIGACQVRNCAVAALVLEILVLFHSMIFIVVNLAYGEEQYVGRSLQVAGVIKYEYLTPVMVLQAVWIAGNVGAIFAVKLVRPALMIPELVARTPAVIAQLIVCILFVVNAAELLDPTDWPLILALSLFVLATLVSLFVTYVMWACYRYLKGAKRRLVVQRFSCNSVGLQSADQRRSSSQTL